jgi:hypothetical protein
MSRDDWDRDALRDRLDEIEETLTDDYEELNITTNVTTVDPDMIEANSSPSSPWEVVDEEDGESDP